MKTLILILVLAISTFGQQRNSVLDVTLPTPGSAGTVTLSLTEYNAAVLLFCLFLSACLRVNPRQQNTPRVAKRLRRRVGTAQS